MNFDLEHPWCALAIVAGLVGGPSFGLLAFLTWGGIRVRRARVAYERRKTVPRRTKDDVRAALKRGEVAGLVIIRVREFTTTPTDDGEGPHSGTWFYRHHLAREYARALASDAGVLVVDLSDVGQVSHAWLRASLGELALDFGKDEVCQRVVVVDANAPIRAATATMVLLSAKPPAHTMRPLRPH